MQLFNFSLSGLILSHLCIGENSWTTLLITASMPDGPRPVECPGGESPSPQLPINLLPPCWKGIETPNLNQIDFLVCVRFDANRYKFKHSILTTSYIIEYVPPPRFMHRHSISLSSCSTIISSVSTSHINIHISC